MPDRDKVIKGLEEISDYFFSVYYHSEDRKETNRAKDMRDTAEDALALLKEQEADKPKGHWMPYKPDRRGYTDVFTCSRCERVILSDHYCKMIDFDFCPYCCAHMDIAEGR